MSASRRIEDLHQDFQPMVRDLIRLGNIAIGQTGYEFFITDGYRSMDEQEKLYAQGRTAPGKIVTMAAPGQSPHNYGLAVDCAFRKDGKLFYLLDLYNKIYPVARSLGFVLGADWVQFKDRPHFEYPSWQTKAHTQATGETKTDFGPIYPVKQNVKITAARGANVRTGPYTNYKSLGAFAYNALFAVIGFVVGEEVAGNRMWWVTQDNKFVWSGATNVIPTLPKDEPKSVVAPSSEIIGSVVTDVSVEQLRSTISALENEVAAAKSEAAMSERKRLKMESILLDKESELTLIREAGANVLAVKANNEYLTGEIASYQQQLRELKSQLSNERVRVFSDWKLAQLDSGMSRFSKLLPVIAKIIGLFITDLTKTHVIGWKVGGKIHMVSSEPEVAEKITGTISTLEPADNSSK